MADALDLDLQRLVDAADDAALLRAVDGLCASRQWDALEELARRCRDAVEVGKQLWGVAMHIDYRLAWEGPAPHAGRAVTPGAGRFTLGPLTEVAASAHTWADLAPHLEEPASRAAVAQERVLRGEDLTGEDVEAELPLRLADFEPDYALPSYRDRTARFPAPAAAATPTVAARDLPAGRSRALDEAGKALHDVVEVWGTESSGRVRVATAEGDGPAAVSRFGARARLVEIDHRDALALLQWAGASGGAAGRRRGGAAGRFAAWWALAALAGLEWDDDHDALAGDLGDAVAELRFWRWAPEPTEAGSEAGARTGGVLEADRGGVGWAEPSGNGGPEHGWVLRLAVADPLDDLAWAIDAYDTAEPDGRLSSLATGR